MELRQFLNIARRWLWLIGLTVAVAATSSYFASRRATPLYRTSTTLMIGTVIQSADPTQGEFATGQTLAEMYAQMAQREPVLRGAVESLGLNIDWRAIAGQVSVRAVPRSPFVEISVVDSNPARAKALADAIAQQLALISPTSASGVNTEERDFAQARISDLKAKMVAAQEEIASLQEQVDAAVSARRIQELKSQIAVLDGKATDWEATYSRLLLFLQGGEINVLSVVEEAQVPTKPISPDTPMNVLVSTAGGLVLAVAAALLIEYLDDTIKSPDDITRASELPTLGGIARIEGESYPEKLISVHHPLSPIVEAYRVLRTNLQFSSVDTPTRTLLVASAGPTEGKSVTLANLAVVMAQSGRKVIAVDSDLRRPVLHKIFSLANSHGLTDAILIPNPGVVEHLQPTLVENLWVLPSGTLPPNPSELLGSKRMGALIEELKGIVDVVLFDSPPSLVVADAAILSTKMDGVLTVYDAGRSRRHEAERAAKELRRVGANLLGAVLNRLSGRRGGYYYYYRTYYYQSEDGERRRRHRRSARERVLGFLGRSSDEPEETTA